MKSNSNKVDAEIKSYNIKKWNYIIRKVVLTRIVPLIILLITINELFYKSYEKNHKSFLILLAVKALLGILVGIFAGTCEWQFNEKLLTHYFKTLEEIKKEYIKIYGILEWGLIIGICYFKYPFEAIYSIIINIVIWLVFGFVLGIFTWRKSKSNYEKFTQNT